MIKVLLFAFIIINTLMFGSATTSANFYETANTNMSLQSPYNVDKLKLKNVLDTAEFAKVERAVLFDILNPNTIVNKSYTDTYHLNLNDTTEFTIYDKYIIYIQNESLNVYNTNTRAISANLTTLTTASNLQVVDEVIYILQNNTICAYTLSLDEIVLSSSQPNDLFADRFVIQKHNENVQLLTNTNSKLTIFNLINNNLTKTKEINLNYTPLFISIYNQDLYVIYDSNQQNKMLIITKESDYETQIASSINYENISNFMVQSINDTPTIILTTNNTPNSIYLIKLKTQGLTYSLVEMFKLDGNSNISIPTYNQNELQTISDMAIFNQQLYIYDKLNHSINVYSFVETITNDDIDYSIELDDVFVGTHSNKLGLFNSPSHINAITSNNILISDTLNNRIVRIVDNQITAFTKYIINTESVNFNYPFYSTQLNDNNILVAHIHNNTTQIVIINPINNKLIKLINYDGTLSSITTNTYNEIFAVNENNDVVISTNFDNFQLYYNASSDFASTPKIENLLNIGLLLYDNTKMLVLEKNDGTVNAIKEIQHIHEIIDLSSDPNNNIYISTTDSLIKIVDIMADSSNLKVQQLQFSTLEINNILHLSISKNDGLVYMFDNSNQQLITLKNIWFSKGLQSFIHAQNITQPTSSISYLKYSQTNSNILVYDYPYFIGNNNQLTQHQIVYVLHQNQNNGFSQILYLHNNNLMQGYVLSNTLTDNDIVVQDTNNYYKTIYKNVRLLKFPTEATYKNSIIALTTININSTFELLSNEIKGLDGNNYYLVNYNNLYGYVNALDIIPATATTIKPLLKTNYKTINITNEIIVYANNSLDSTQTHILASNYPIYVESLNIDSELTFIRFLDKNNIEHSGYIETINIKQNLTTEKNITALIITLLGATLLIATFIFYKKLNKKSKD